jgi:hypothetical protein
MTPPHPPGAAAEMIALRAALAERDATIAAKDAEIARLRTWLGEAIVELDGYYQAEYAGDHPYSVRKLAQARASWDEARAALQEPRHD